MGDSLFPVYNNFFIGAYQAAINEASEMQGLSDTEATERDCYMYRAYIALGSYQVSAGGKHRKLSEHGKAAALCAPRAGWVLSYSSEY